MAFKAITINTDASVAAHILAQDDANLYNAIFGTDCVLDIDSKMAASIISNNLIRIAPGACVVQGHFGRIPYGEYVDIPIENGTSGKYRNDIIVARFSISAGIDTFKLDVVKGTPGVTAADPAVTIGDLNKGDTLREFALFRVKLNGLSITAVEAMFSIGTSLKTINNSLAKTEYKSSVTFFSGFSFLSVALNSIIKDGNGLVILNFTLSCGALATDVLITACTLPTDLIPSLLLVFPGVVSTGNNSIDAKIRITTSGEVTISPSTAISGGVVSFHVAYYV